ncbi:hypothetical protein ACFE04_027802 [Oxalis oulophora]
MAGDTYIPTDFIAPMKLLLVIHGSLQVGFVDTTNKLFTWTLQLADVFVFRNSFTTAFNIEKLPRWRFNFVALELRKNAGGLRCCSQGLTKVSFFGFADFLQEQANLDSENYIANPRL